MKGAAIRLTIQEVHPIVNMAVPTIMDNKMASAPLSSVANNNRTPKAGRKINTIPVSNSAIAV
jgi:hypothetical protein